MRLLKISYFKRDRGKDDLIFPLHPVPFYGHNFEKQKV